MFTDSVGLRANRLGRNYSSRISMDPNPREIVPWAQRLCWCIGNKCPTRYLLGLLFIVIVWSANHEARLHACRDFADRHSREIVPQARLHEYARCCVQPLTWRA